MILKKIKIKSVSLFCLIVVIISGSYNNAISQTLPWTYVNTGVYHTILIQPGTVLINGVSININDYIGVFYEDNGVLECSGYVEYTGISIAIQACEDNNLTSDKDGFDANEAFQWKVWREIDGQEVIVTATYSPGFPNQANFTVNGISAILSMIGNATLLPLSGTGVETNVSCFGDLSGIIDITVTGGMYPHLFQWSNGETTEDLINIGAGTYTVTISDPNVFPWSYTNTGSNHTILMMSGTVEINGNPIEVGDYFGVFFMDGSDYVCGGYSIWTGSSSNAVTAWGDDTQTPVKDGFASNESFNWKVWKASDDSIVDMTAIYTIGGPFPNAGTYEFNGMSSITSMVGYYTPGVINNIILSFTITQPPEQIIDVLSNNINVIGNNDGFIDLTLAGGNPPVSFLWSNGQTTEDLNNLIAGNYSYSITDAIGCEFIDTICINQPVDFNTSTTDISCGNNCSGEINISILGGIEPFTYLWSNNGSGNVQTNLCAGLYSITVYDSAIPAFDTIFNLNINALSSLSLSAQISDYSGYGISSIGAADGFINLTVTGGISPITFLWSNGSTTEDLANLEAGLYTVSITDSINCILEETFIINQPIAITTNYNNPTCFSLCNGDINMVVTGGVTPYSFIWSTGGSSASLTGLCEGTYEITFSDATGYNDVMNFVLVSPAELLISDTISDYSGYNTSGAGINDGWIDITITGGQPPYNYYWSTGQTTEDINSLIPGTYFVTVTDSSGCTINTSYTLISEPFSTVLSAYGVIDSISCNGNCNGSIDLTVSGGTTGYSYLWNNGSNDEDISNLCAATYWVSVTDMQGYNTNPFNWSYNYNVDNHVIAIMSNSVFVNGMLPEPGDYLGVFYDNNGTLECGGYFSWTGTNIVIVAMKNSNMTTGKDGFDNGDILNWKLWRQSDSIEVNMTPVYTMSEPNQGIFQTNGISSLISLTGSYNPTGIQQSVVLSFDITEPDPIEVSPFVIHINTMWNMTGQIGLYTLGGAPPYSYLWSTSDTGNHLYNIADTGFYSVAITDANFCELVDSFYVAYDSISSISISEIVTNVDCYGNATGQIDITVSGGIPSYNFIWSTGEQTEDISLLPAGFYTVTINDYSGLTTSYSFEITQPDELNLQAVINDVSAISGNDGSINLYINGGSPDYSVLWSNSDTLQLLNNLSEGNYAVEVTDNMNCIVYGNFYVSFPYSGYPIVLSASQTDILCSGDSNGTVAISASGGYPPYNYEWSNGLTTQNLNNLSGGSYTVSVIDDFINYAFGGILPWTYTNTGIIHNLTINSSGTIVDGSPLPTGALIGAFYDDSGVYKCGGYIEWQGTTANLSVMGDDPGTSIKDGFAINEILRLQVYSPFVFYNTRIEFGAPFFNSINFTENGLSFVNDLFSPEIISLEVILSEPIQIEIIPNISDFNGFGISSFMASDGFIDLSITGGTPPFSFMWNNGGTTEDLSNIPSGIYEVTIIDSNLCDTILSFEITSPLPDPISSNATITNVQCYGFCDGEILIQATGGIPPLNYFWSNGESTALIDNLCPGSYQLTISDVDSSLVLTFEIIQPDSLICSFIVTPVDPVAGIDGSIDATTSGGTFPYSFYWSDGSITEDILGATYGQYYLTVTDDNACQGIFETFVNLSLYPDWDLYPTTYTHTVDIPSNAALIINGANIQANDFIGVFYDSSGVEKCGGYVNWQNQSVSLTVYGDDPLTVGFEGFAIGEEFSWKFWDASQDSVYNAFAVYSSLYLQQNQFTIAGSSAIDSLYTNSISGSVYITSKSVLDLGMVVIYEQTPYGYYAVVKGLITNGNYYIDGLKTGSYICYAIPKPDNDWGIPGYFTTRDDWQGASSVYVNANTTGIDITLDPVLPYATGNGSISGQVSVGNDASYNPDIFGDEWFPENKFNDGEPARNIPVLLYDSLQNAIDFRLTGQDGMFVYENLELGTYFVKIEKAGLEAEHIKVILDENNPDYNNFSFILNEGQVVSVNQFASNSKIEVFPNPAMDKLFIILPEGLGLVKSIDIYNESGIKQKAVFKNLGVNFQIDVSSYCTGLYIIHLVGENTSAIVKFIKY